MSFSVNRREFMTATSGALLAAPILDAAADTPPVRVAVVGTGGRGSDLIRKLADLREAEIVGICDNYSPHLKYGAKYAGEGVATFKSYETMLAETKPEAVFVAVPLHLHYEMSIQALDQDAHVYCEKSLCYSLAQAQALAARVTALGAVFQVGLQRRANPVYEQAAAMVQSGMLGTITAVKCQWHRNHPWRRPLPIGAEDPRHARLERKLNWRLYREYSHGLYTELASHQMDVVNRILGVPPARVFATGGVDYWRDGREAEDNIFCTYEYALTDPATPEAPHRTVRATYSALLSNAFEGASELFMGTKGSLLITRNKCLFYREGVAVPDAVAGSGNPDGADAVTSGKTLLVNTDPWVHRGKPTEFAIEGDDTRWAVRSFLQHVQTKNPETICD
ncbi:MAG: Gfo/Idh/MocA family oxidoreductase, partial [Candidatus Hydrogenedentes bacterium]|nr:Gfo/Idh/MocA family oxidoreductase [Candidatus Hydrogenedentota bacterium]